MYDERGRPLRRGKDFGIGMGKMGQRK